MKMKASIRTLLQTLIAVSALLILAACGGSSDSPSSSSGKLSVSLTDATLYQYQGVYVTIDEVSVHVGATITGGTTETDMSDNSGDAEGEWKVVATPGQTVNLLELVNGVLLHLGLTDLEAGHYTQLRMAIGDEPEADTTHPYANYIITEDGVPHELKVPSNKIKLVRGFDINAGETTELILDFDAAKSVVKAGKEKNNKGAKWILKPTIKVLGQYALIHGTVSDSNGGLPDALVSAQYNDETDTLTIAAATVSEDTGKYTMFVDPGTYNVVAYAAGYDPQCIFGDTDAPPNAGLTADFTLIANATGATLTGNVSIIGDEADEQVVNISVRKLLPCSDTPVEILSQQVTEGSSYSFNLPAISADAPAEEKYTVVASSIGEETQVSEEVALPDGDTVTIDFTF